MIRGIGRLRAKASVDADALGWAAAVTANSGTYSASTLSAMSTLISALKAAGLWTKMACFGPLAGDQLAAALIQYKGGTWAAATNVNFVSGDYTEATGLTGNGSNKYLNTGFAQNTLTAASRHMATYDRVLPSANQASIGSDASGSNTWMLQNVAGSYSYFAAGNGANAGSAAAAATAGFYVGVSETSTSLRIYKNGASVATSAPTALVPSAENQGVFAKLRGGVAGAFSAGTLGGYSMGEILTAGEVAALYPIVQAFQTALGRQV